jgi:hypothetical protein
MGNIEKKGIETPAKLIPGFLGAYRNLQTFDLIAQRLMLRIHYDLAGRQATKGAASGEPPS